ncbi:MAG TPA: DUF177 domain-containing protein [Thermoanaerobaculia bacterium]|nr:DUF177 domain-containing protein [Thermoanaerobaculia bacterium]
MKIRLHEIGDEPYAWDEEERVSPAALDRPEVLELGPVSWSGRISRLDGPDGGYLLRGRISYEQTLACQRCLAEVVEPVTEEVELLVLSHDPGIEEEERELQEKDLGVLVVEGEELDLGPVLREQIQLNVPMRPLCREECAGLCPTCGADLNRGPCQSGPPAADPRGSGLAALRDSLPGGPEK